jgi:hypothetical protein
MLNMEKQEQKNVSIVQTLESINSDISYLLSSYRQMLIQYEKQVAELVKENEGLRQKLSNVSSSS